LVRVTIDNGERQVWLAATERDQAVDYVLDAIPDGWTASLVQRELSRPEVEALNMKPGEVRRHQVS
jgi:23S rRNA C2498 (ribose-2'-O)-methylase RlmM